MFQRNSLTRELFRLGVVTSSTKPTHASAGETNVPRGDSDETKTPIGIGYGLPPDLGRVASQQANEAERQRRIRP